MDHDLAGRLRRDRWERIEDLGEGRLTPSEFAMYKTAQLGGY
jgi:hypothetical protein